MACGRGFDSPRFHHSRLPQGPTRPRAPKGSRGSCFVQPTRVCAVHQFVALFPGCRLLRRTATGLLVALLAALVGCATPPPAWQGQDAAAAAWQRVTAGLDYRSFSPWPDSRVHVLRLDLREPGLRLEVSPPQARGLAMDRRPEATVAVASFNASFFDRNFVPRGLTVSQGQTWTPVLQAEASPWLACDPVQRCRIKFTDTGGAGPADVVNAVAGTPWLVRAGQVRSEADDARCAALCARTHPRTAVGLAGQGRWLLVVLAEGRRPPVAGVTLVQLSQLMRELGADDAINLDGGGSSTLWLQGRAVMARPANEPEERALSNVVSIVQSDNNIGMGGDSDRP